jgi:hypothetical protein
MLFRIVKKYNNKSALNGIVQSDTIEFADRSACARFVLAVNNNPSVGYEIVDYEQALVTTDNKAEILENPTGGFVGKCN